MDLSRHRPRAGRCPRLVAGAALLAVALTGCGGEGSSGEAGDVSDADVRFATRMTQHHAQTLRLLNMPQTLRMPDRDVSWTDGARSERLAEVEELTSLLQGWGEPVPATGLDHASEGEHVEPDAGIEGVLPAGEVADIRRTRGPAFADRWLRAILEHERGALALARAQADGGSDPDAVRLAEQDVARHADLVETLEGLTGG